MQGPTFLRTVKGLGQMSVLDASRAAVPADIYLVYVACRSLPVLADRQRLLLSRTQEVSCAAAASCGLFAGSRMRVYWSTDFAVLNDSAATTHVLNAVNIQLLQRPVPLVQCLL